MRDIRRKRDAEIQRKARRAGRSTECKGQMGRTGEKHGMWAESAAHKQGRNGVGKVAEW